MQSHRLLVCAVIRRGADTRGQHTLSTRLPRWIGLDNVPTKSQASISLQAVHKLPRIIREVGLRRKRASHPMECRSDTMRQAIDASGGEEPSRTPYLYNTTLRAFERHWDQRTP